MVFGYVNVSLIACNDGCRAALGAKQIFRAYARSSIAFCTSLFADRNGVAASRILLVAAPCETYCVLQLKVVNRIVMAA